MISVTALAQIVACGATKRSGGEHKVTPSFAMVADDPRANKEISDGLYSVTVIGGAELQRLQASGKVTKNFASLDSTLRVVDNRGTPGEGEGLVEAESMYVAYPIKMLGEGSLFGGVITTVSNNVDETLGGLKLTDLPPIHSRLLLNKDANENYSVVLVGCIDKCSELSEQVAFLSLPVVGVTEDEKSLVLDLAKFGEDFNLLDVVGAEGEYTGLKTISARTSGIDYATATLVWDVVNTMIPLDADAADTQIPRTEIGARFYLKLESGLNSAFVSRKPINSVGFFGTTFAADPLITRFSATSFNGEAPVHYYIKNVPAEEKANFAQAMDSWNKVFNEVIDRDLLSYEFIDSGSQESEAVIAGDIRYNVIEWDLVNEASYGGLGPSIASQTTGQIFSGNILVQGPSIHKIYKQWFGLAEEVKKLEDEEKAEEASALFLRERRKILAALAANEAVKTGKPKLGALNFRTNKNNDALKDPLASRQDFFSLPDGESYESFMKGYWANLVGHEMGHNLGLRHNFRGNLYANEDSSGTSSSIMEYLNREFRNRNPQGFYDTMAIAYGYAGKIPVREDLFCTDENVFSAEDPNNSAECSRDDATTDSFSYLTKVSQRALDYLVARGSFQAPTWTVADVTNEFGYSLQGRLAYAVSAEATSKTWINWAKENRPTDPGEIKAYVLKALQTELCQPGIRKAAEQKHTQEAKDVVAKNLADLDKFVADEVTKLRLDAASLSCK